MEVSSMVQVKKAYVFIIHMLTVICIMVTFFHILYLLIDLFFCLLSTF